MTVALTETSFQVPKFLLNALKPTQDILYTKIQFSIPY